MQNKPSWQRGLERLCLKKLKDYGGHGTARQIAADLGKEMGLISPRLSVLAKEGLIYDSGARAGAGRGRPLVVWRVCDVAGAVVEACDL